MHNASHIAAVRSTAVEVLASVTHAASNHALEHRQLGFIIQINLIVQCRKMEEWPKDSIVDKRQMLCKENFYSSLTLYEMNPDVLTRHLLIRYIRPVKEAAHSITLAPSISQVPHHKQPSAKTITA